MDTLVEKVLEYGSSKSNKVAVCFKEQTVTYGEMMQRVRAMAGILKEMGIAEGDRVMLSAVSKPEYIAALLAIQYVHAVTVQIDKTAKTENIVDIWQTTDAVLFLVDGKKLPDEVKTYSLKKIYAQSGESENTVFPQYTKPDKNSLCELLFTTGSTGKPKGVMLSYGCIFANTLNTCNGISIVESDRILNPLPLNHSFGMRVLRATLFTGATVVLQNGFTFAKEIENNIEMHNCTGMVCVPASIELIYRQMQDHFAEILGKLRYMEFGAGSVSVDMKKKLLKLLPNTHLYNTWGSTETGGAIFLDLTKNPDKAASIGKPIKGVDIKIVDTQGNAIDAKDINTAGRMVLRGDMQMEGYWRAPDITGETIRDGWLHTNDMVYQDSDGFVYMLGRADDIINVGGEKVSPIEVENIAQEYEEIRECACIGVADPEGILGQVPVLYVVSENGMVDESAFIKYLNQHVEKYKIPQEIIQIAELPRNRMKKIDRNALINMYNQRDEVDLNNPVICNMLARRSIRDFTSQPIDKRYIEMMLKAAIHAPSGHNMQTWRFTVLTSQDEILKFKQIVKDCSEKNKVHFYGFNHPMALILVSNDRRNPDGVQDCSCAAQNIMLAAESFGIGSVWLNPLMTQCDDADIRALLQGYAIPDNHIVWATIALGYPQNAGSRLAKKENVVRWIEG